MCQEESEGRQEADLGSMPGAALGHYRHSPMYCSASENKSGGKWQEGVRTRVSRPLRSLCSCFSASPSSPPQDQDTEAPAEFLLG